MNHSYLADSNTLAQGAEAGRRVALIVAGLDGGGLERVVRSLAFALRDRGWHPAIFCMMKLGEYAAGIQKAGIPVIDCREGPIRLRGIPIHLIRALSRFRPALLHAQSGAWFPTAIAKTALRQPRLIFSDHGRYSPEPRWSAQIDRWCNRRTDHLVAVAPPLAEYLKHFLDLPVSPEVIPNGIELDDYRGAPVSARAAVRAELGIPPDAVLIMAVGRLERVKNYGALLTAMHRIGDKAPAFHVAIVGTGALRAELEAQASALGIASRVRFVGFRTDIPNCLRAADVFAIPSLTEAFPLALVEAMASGLPVMASNVGAMGELVAPPGQAPAGILVDPGNVDSLSSALLELISHPEQRRQMAATAAQRAGAYSVERMVDRYVDVYEGALGAPAGSR